MANLSNMASALLYLAEGINASALIECKEVDQEWEAMWSDATVWVPNKA